MSAFTDETRTSLYRWGISVAAALAVHAVIAVVVLTWWPRALVSPPPPRTVEVDLTPEPPAPGVQASKPAPEPSASQASPEKSPDQTDRQREEKTAARSEPKVEPKPVEEAPAVAPSGPPAPSAGDENRDQAAGGGGSGAGANPIDLRIAEQRRERFKKAAKGHDWKTAIMPRAPKAVFAGRHAPAGQGAPGGVARNAIGMVVPDRAGASGTMVPGTAANTGGGPAVNGVNGAATSTNAIGLSVTSYPSVAGVAAPRPAIGPVASIGGLNGTTMVRPGAGTGSIGGPSKTVAGVINGTGMKPRP